MLSLEIEIIIILILTFIFTIFLLMLYLNLFGTRGWIILLFLQAIYLSLNLVSDITNNSIYEIMATSAILSLGVLYFVITFVEKKHTGHLKLHDIIESIFYLSFGLVLLIIRINNRKKEFIEKKRILKQAEELKKCKE